jgi:ornithine cyclodeaminase/alanine dehydrogenase-like protein (mu-crystallin family)
VTLDPVTLDPVTLDGLPRIDEAALRQLVPPAAAVDALEQALRDGFDPAGDAPRSIVPVPSGQILSMPSSWGDFAGTKLITLAPGNPSAGLPRIHGIYLLLDGATLRPIALLDGAALTTLRTPAVSALGVRHLAPPSVDRLVVFGTGPQAAAHVEALRAVRDVGEVLVVGRTAARVDEVLSALAAGGVPARSGTPEDVATADVVVCATAARSPLFDGGLVRGGQLVVAIGSHEPDAAEVDADLVGRSAVVVEDRATALREAGDVVRAVAAGTIDAEALIPLADVVRGEAVLPAEGPRLFKSVGMSWEDLVIAAAAYTALRASRRG